MCATLFLNSAKSVGVRRLAKAVPDAPSHSFFKCPTFGAGELSVPPLSGLGEKKQRVKKKKKRAGKKTPPGRNDSRYRREGDASKVSAISKGK